MGQPCARARVDSVAHPLPPTLNPGPGSTNVFCGNAQVWRGIPLAAVAALQTAKQAADIAVQAAVSAKTAASGTPGYPAAEAAEQTAKTTALSTMTAAVNAAVSAGSAASMGKGTPDIHSCTVPSPVPPHGPGVDITGSATVMVNGLPCGRMNDTILEPLGPPNKITSGEMRTMIGG